jgi:hypothetical protein
MLHNQPSGPIIVRGCLACGIYCIYNFYRMNYRTCWKMYLWKHDCIYILYSAERLPISVVQWKRIRSSVPRLVDLSWWPTTLPTEISRTKHERCSVPAKSGNTRGTLLHRIWVAATVIKNYPNEVMRAMRWIHKRARMFTNIPSIININNKYVTVENWTYIYLVFLIGMTSGCQVRVLSHE